MTLRGYPLCSPTRGTSPGVTIFPSAHMHMWIFATSSENACIRGTVSRCGYDETSYDLLLWIRAVSPLSSEEQQHLLEKPTQIKSSPMLVSVLGMTIVPLPPTLLLPALLPRRAPPLQALLVLSRLRETLLPWVSLLPLLVLLLPSKQRFGEVNRRLSQHDCEGR